MVALSGLCELGDTRGSHHPQGVDVETAVRFVEYKPRPGSSIAIWNIVALLLAAGESSLTLPRSQLGVDLHYFASWYASA